MNIWFIYKSYASKNSSIPWMWNIAGILCSVFRVMLAGPRSCCRECFGKGVSRRTLGDSPGKQPHSRSQHSTTLSAKQNIHLVAKWLPKLEKTLEQYSVDSHEAYRVFMSAEPAPTPESHIIPQVHVWRCQSKPLCNGNTLPSNQLLEELFWIWQGKLFLGSCIKE